MASQDVVIRLVRENANIKFNKIFKKKEKPKELSVYSESLRAKVMEICVDTYAEDYDKIFKDFEH